LRRRGVDIVAVRTAFGVDPMNGAEYLRCIRAEPKSEADPAPEAADPQPDPTAKADSLPSGPPAELEERRGQRRDAGFQARALRVEYAGRRMSAALADYSAGGVGLYMRGPVPTGAQITVQGELEGPAGEVTIDALGRVRHCRFGDKAFRLGVAFDPPR